MKKIVDLETSRIPGGSERNEIRSFQTRVAEIALPNPGGEYKDAAPIMVFHYACRHVDAVSMFEYDCGKPIKSYTNNRSRCGVRWVGSSDSKCFRRS